MPYRPPASGELHHKCPVCDDPANLPGIGAGLIVLCSRCGDFGVEKTAAEVYLQPQDWRDVKKRALASHLIRGKQEPKPPILEEDFFKSLSGRTLPTPTEMCDNLLLWIDKTIDGRPGTPVAANPHPHIQATIGAISGEDVRWAHNSLAQRGLIDGTFVSASGWQRIADLKHARISSQYAFFARQFENAELNQVFDRWLRQAVADTGYELRTVTQKAGHIDAIIEDEIRRCRFLIADLSSGNAGAYWEAGFAEGLGKPVIYVCRDGVTTHFDTYHRHTVRWEPSKLDETAAQLKAVIRNTLLGEARQGH